MTTAPNKSPLDVARDFCGKNPAALPAGRYKVVDRVDRREPSPETLHDSGTDKLLARAAAVTDTVDTSTYAKAAASAMPCAECGHPTLGAFGPAPQFNYWRSICQVCKNKADAELERHAKGSAAAVDRMVRESLGLPVNVAGTAPIDLGDGLGLPLVSVGPSGLGGYAQTEIAVPTCLTCGRTTLGSDECTDCARSRHNDDDAQGAAQERADVEGEVGDE